MPRSDQNNNRGRGPPSEKNRSLAKKLSSAMAQRRGDFRPNSELSQICTELWELDENRLKPGVDYQIDLQGGKTAVQYNGY